ncbi:MAG: hypothetical protein JST26_13415 [Bacteroidetes bacterium]|nr:hypothetical protein [Bacteroidota bacterium]
MRSFYFLLATLSVFIFSCKKNTSKTASDNPSGSCTCLNDNTGFSSANSSSCYGFLSMTTYSDMTGSMPVSYVATRAFFSGVANYQESANSTVMVDSVCLNQQSLNSVKDSNGNHMYYENDYNTLPLQQAWSVFGANGIPTFTYTASINNPVADFSTLPASISLSLVKSFGIHGVTNITNGTAIIFSESNSSNNNVSVALKEGSNEVCFPKDQLNQVGAGPARILIILENKTVKVFNGKNFAFSKKLQYEKKITLNP